MANKQDLYRLYKSETGHAVIEYDIGVIRKRGQWILDPQEVDDQFVIEKLFGYSGRICVPDVEYIEWLEEKIQGKLL